MKKQECIPVGSVLPAHYYTRGISVQEGLCPGVSGQRPPGRNIGPEAQTPIRNMGPETQTPEGTWYQAARQEVTSYRDPLTLCEQND